MVKITFLTDRKVDAADGEQFLKGKSYEVSEASAERWFARGLAVLTADYKASPGVAIARDVESDSTETKRAATVRKSATKKIVEQSKAIK